LCIIQCQKEWVIRPTKRYLENFRFKHLHASLFFALFKNSAHRHSDRINLDNTQLYLKNQPSLYFLCSGDSEIIALL
jgi:hypothetical protein